MVGAVATAAKTLEAARRLQTRARLTTQMFAVLWRGGFVLLLAFALDMVWPWPLLLRELFMIAWVGGIGFGLGRSWRQEQRARPREEQVAREIEALHPGLDNALIHAVQFGSQPTLTGTQADLIRRELARAEREAAHLSPQAGVARAPMQRLCLVLVGGFMLLSALLTPQAASGSRPKPESKGGPRAQSLAQFSKDNTEKPDGASPKPSTRASDKEAARYPTEYRRLVRDYFKSVAGQK